MCGITGVFQLNKYIESPKEIISMNRSINHRGPDDYGLVLFSFINNKYQEIDNQISTDFPKKFEGFVGFNRLSIVDLSKNGHQPMINDSGNVILCFNGEIYNAFEYKDILQSKGFKFKSKSDTEIILYLYECYGFENMLSKLNGMFAISIIDLKKGLFFLARDRLGIKPMYYYKNNDVFIFSSEVKAFLYNNYFSPELQAINVDEYIKFGYVCNNETLFKNVYMIEPGQYLKTDGNFIEKHKYWDIYNDNELISTNLDQATSVLENELTKSLKLRLMSDVKIGCQLSGGIDSSLITLLTSKNLGEYDLNSISIILEDNNFSEEIWIDQVTAITGVNNHKYVLTSEYFSEKFRLATWHFDFPIMMPNSIGIFLLAEKAREFFTVFLSGEGADELLGGYTRFHGGKILNNNIFAFLLRYMPYYRKYLDSWYINSPGQNSFNAIDWFITTTTHLSLDTMKKMKKDIDLSYAMIKRREIFDSGSGDFIKKAQRYELKTWLVDLLMRQDKMTMANSIENRVPLLDHNLVDICRRLPSNLLTRSGLSTTKNTKIILKKIAEKYFGSGFAYRSKSGFALPLGDFFKEKRFNEWINDVIIPGTKNRGIFNSSLLEQRINQNNLNEEQIQSLWSMISFETWAEMFLDKKFY